MKISSYVLPWTVLRHECDEVMGKLFVAKRLGVHGGNLAVCAAHFFSPFGHRHSGLEAVAHDSAFECDDTKDIDRSVLFLDSFPDLLGGVCAFQDIHSVLWDGII